MASYTCNVGYILIGATSRTCQLDERWSGAAPTCDGEISLYSLAGYLMNWYLWESLCRILHADDAVALYVRLLAKICCTMYFSLALT